MTLVYKNAERTASLRTVFPRRTCVRKLNGKINYVISGVIICYFKIKYSVWFEVGLQFDFIYYRSIFNNLEIILNHFVFGEAVKKNSEVIRRFKMNGFFGN